MFKNKAADGKNNICSAIIAEKRKSIKPRMSQKKLADLLQIKGLDVDKNAIQKIESGERFVTDIEIKFISEVLDISYDELLD